MSDKKILFFSVTTALLAEVLLVFIIYLNPYKISPLMDSAIHITLNASFNGVSALFLLIAFICVNLEYIKAHKLFILMALSSSACFLVSYILYHMSIGHTVFSHNEYRNIYLLLLASHLVCSFISLPLIFTTTIFGVLNKVSAHKKLAMVTFFLWEYVSISGVLIVLFLKFLNK